MVVHSRINYKKLLPIFQIALLLGHYSGFVPNAPNSRKLLSEQYGAYVSDQWRARTDLTLNFGLRYAYYTPVRSGGQLGNGTAYQDLSTTNDPGGRLIDLMIRINF